MDVEFSKIPIKGTGVNSMAMKKKKEELEFELDVNAKNINTIKQKLRDMDAL